MNIRYNRAIAIVLLAFGIIDAVALLVLLLLGSLSPLQVGGLITLYFAYLMLTRSYFMVEDNQIVLYALAGPAQRTYPITSSADVKIEGNSIFVRKDNGWQRVTVARWLVNREDWAALEARFKRP
jgi:hypothetical protein